MSEYVEEIGLTAGERREAGPDTRLDDPTTRTDPDAETPGDRSFISRGAAPAAVRPVSGRAVSGRAVPGRAVPGGCHARRVGSVERVVRGDAERLLRGRQYERPEHNRPEHDRPDTTGQHTTGQHTTGQHTAGAYEESNGIDVGEVSVGELVGNVTKDLSTLMRQEFALAQAEVKAEVRKTGKAAGALGAAGFAGYMAVLFLSICLWWVGAGQPHWQRLVRVGRRRDLGRHRRRALRQRPKEAS